MLLALPLLVLRSLSVAAVLYNTCFISSAFARLEDDLWQRGKIHRVVLTGGPCGGKSVSAARGTYENAMIWHRQHSTLS